MDDAPKRTAFLVLNKHKELIDAFIESERYDRASMEKAASSVASVSDGVVLAAEVVVDFRPGQKV